jgi:hypothetical protein
MMQVFYLLLFGLPVLVGWIAHKNGRRWWAWGLWAVILPSPLILVVVLLSGRPLDQTPPPIKYVDAFDSEEQP